MKTCPTRTDLPTLHQLAHSAFNFLEKYRLVSTTFTLSTMKISQVHSETVFHLQQECAGLSVVCALAWYALTKAGSPSGSARDQAGAGVEVPEAQL